MNHMFSRAITLPERPSTSFFLWGPRQTGKSTLLHALYPGAFWIDLLQTDLFFRYGERPHLLREETAVLARGSLVVIDEIQKTPPLLDEVHWLIENRKLVFALSGSSARRLRRTPANLLGGRARRFELSGLVSREVEPAFDLVRMLNRGYLPSHYLSETAEPLLQGYVHDYLKEEILFEGLVRRLPVFSSFLSAAALSDTEMLSYATIARDCAVSGHTVRDYYQILVDTLLGHLLPAYTKRPKRRVIRAPKFYFDDVGVVNCLARRGVLQPRSELFGKAFENWVFHELRCYSAYHGRPHELSYWRLAGGTEVDFIVDDMALAIEAKATAHVTSDHLKGLRELAVDHRSVKRRFIVSLDAKRRITEDGIEVLPYKEFAGELWSGSLLR